MCNVGSTAPAASASARRLLAPDQVHLSTPCTIVLFLRSPSGPVRSWELCAPMIGVLTSLTLLLTGNSRGSSV